MNLAAWAERNGVARVTAYRWFRSGLLRVSAQRVGRLILVDEPTAGPRERTAVYAWVSSADQKEDLDRQVARVCAWTTAQQIPVDKVVTEVGSALNGHRRKFLALLGDRSVHRVVVEHRDRFWLVRIGVRRGRVGQPRRAASWWWWTLARLLTTWCGT